MKKQKVAFNSALLFSFSLNTILTIVEIIAGYMNGSFALISDGYKNLTDSLLLLVALVAEKLSVKRSRKIIFRRSAIINAIILLVVSMDLFWNGINRIHHPRVSHGLTVVIIALLAIIINLIAATKIRKEKQAASRSAYIGLLFSALSGSGVLVSAIISRIYNVGWPDAVTGLLIAVVLFTLSCRLLLKAVIAVR